MPFRPDWNLSVAMGKILVDNALVKSTILETIPSGQYPPPQKNGDEKRTSRLASINAPTILAPFSDSKIFFRMSSHFRYSNRFLFLDDFRSQN